MLGEDRAIVTATAGTTRDTLHGELSLDGLPVRLTDTAGLRKSDDPIEVMGMKRAEAALEAADCVLWVVDDADENGSPPKEYQAKSLVVRNKCDLTGKTPGGLGDDAFRTCALTGADWTSYANSSSKSRGFARGSMRLLAGRATSTR